MISTIFQFLSEILQADTLKAAKLVEDESLQKLLPNLQDLQNLAYAAVEKGTVFLLLMAHCTV